MTKLQKKFILIFLFAFLVCFLHALSFGFDLTSENIFLEKKDNPYYPEVVSSFDVSFFLSHSFLFKNANLSIAPGFFIDSQYNIEKKELGKITTFPFFRRFNFSVFSEYLSFSFAKDTIHFGEGFFNINNYFSLNSLVKKTTAIYHILLEVPINQFSFSLGSAIDTKAIEHFRHPDWYQAWFTSSYSNHIITIGFESDILFNVPSKNTILKMASELVFSLPLDFMVYTSGRLPINLHDKKIVNWGTFIGGSKSFILEDYNFTSILGASYSSDGLGYYIFQNIGIKEVITFTLGLQGANKNAVYFVVENIFFISNLKLRLSYITKNLLQDENMQGIFSIGVSLND